MFADDLVLLATSMDTLQLLFGHVQYFCTEEALTINADKTKLLICGPAARLFPSGGLVSFGDLHFQVVCSFKYLGLHFDSLASSKHMLTHLL